MLAIRNLSNCVLCDSLGIIRFAVHILHVILMNVKIYNYMTKCTKTSEIMLSMDGQNYSIRKCFSDIDL